ncbi:single-stranded DNA-binding protein [Dactylosporangium aurantiacum]|uniref:Single-stranded DNA-binding protein n=1 Tax=Dactylosporangium aurantiacum TaxID=35754 RepID=A0A9Q9IJ14_9ACTN|nr:single-stranded DNA-binding protein [Dactylosporangium aurantiacum]MDG6104754.1 single-stranded DNA-binding protein [Dactylosporangium aurantiacum]UWZ55683.1 single-stranded DNA-binding protein [Dactylosporangium aurantiacum]
MNETTMTIVGNVLNEPECRRIEQGGQLVTHFKVAATARRYDRHQERWVDGDQLRLRVNCWRQLAENVMRCVHVGDPVIVTGRLSSRTWETEEHVKRVSYELEAATVGHDLTRGRAKFARVRANTSTSTIDDELAETRIAGQPSTPVAAFNDLPRQRDYDAELGGFVTTVQEPAPDLSHDPFADDVLAELDSAVSAAFDGSAFAAMAGLTAPADAGQLTAADAVPDDASQLMEGGVVPHDASQLTEGGAADEEDADDESDGSGDPDSGTTPAEPGEASGNRRRRSRGGRVPVPA